MLLRESCGEKFLEPVGVRIGDAVLHAVFVDTVRICLSRLPSRDGRIREDVCLIHVVGSLVHEIHVSGIVTEPAYLVVWSLHHCLHRVGHARLAGAFFGSDENNSVCRTRTVDCSRRRILEHRHTLDVGRIDIIHAPLHAVHENERAVVVESRVSPDAETRTVLSRLA